MDHRIIRHELKAMTLTMIMITMIKMVKIVIRKQWYFRKSLMKILYQCFSKKTYQSFSHLRTQILICLFCSLHNIAQDWCYKVIILPSCNVSIMFLGCLYYSLIWGYNYTIMLRANEASVFFNQSYLKKEYTQKTLDIWLTSEEKGKQTRFDIRCSNSKDM